MKSESAVKSKLRQTLYRHRKKELQGSLRIIPSNCVHNVQMVGQEGVSIGVCGHGRTTDQWNQRICDGRHGGQVVASQCPYFQTQDPELLKEQFKEFLRGASPGEIALRYPDVMALKWVLDLGDFEDILLELEKEAEEEDQALIL